MDQIQRSLQTCSDIVTKVGELLEQLMDSGAGERGTEEIRWQEEWEQRCEE